LFLTDLVFEISGVGERLVVSFSFHVVLTEADRIGLSSQFQIDI
jgi:hypothetical protein